MGDIGKVLCFCGIEMPVPSGSDDHCTCKCGKRYVCTRYQYKVEMGNTPDISYTWTNYEQNLRPFSSGVV